MSAIEGVRIITKLKDSNTPKINEFTALAFMPTNSIILVANTLTTATIKDILTGLDYWLDNLMCQVPEVLMCFHLDGIVQKYELYKTEDLPALSEGGNFSPGVIRDVAQNILSCFKPPLYSSDRVFALG